MSPPGEVPVDKRLIGKWETNGDDNEDSLSRLRIYKFNEYEYLLDCQFGSDKLFARACTSLIDGIPFANIQGLETDDDDDFIICRYQLTDEGTSK